MRYWRRRKKKVDRPKRAERYYVINCPHCQKRAYVSVSDLWGRYGRVLRCRICNSPVRFIKRTHTHPDKCKTCENLVECLGAPILRVGTGTIIKPINPNLDWESHRGWAHYVMTITPNSC